MFTTVILYSILHVDYNYYIYIYIYIYSSDNSSDSKAWTENDDQFYCLPSLNCVTNCFTNCFTKFTLVPRTV